MEKDVSFEQIKGAMGSLLLLWAAIERAARQEVAQAHDGCVPKSAYGISAVLSAWESSVVAAQSVRPFGALLAARLRVKLQKPLDIRNGICHGLVGVSAGFGQTPATLTWEINDTPGSVTWDELQIIFSWLSKVPAGIELISNADLKKGSSRMTDSPTNRDWWLTEYGIDLI